MARMRHLLRAGFEDEPLHAIIKIRNCVAALTEAVGMMLSYVIATRLAERASLGRNGRVSLPAACMLRLPRQFAEVQVEARIGKLGE
jgi:hypothetical protein